jgi:putative SOS response-associated peptidase YedK
MCGRAKLSVSENDLRKLFQLEEIPLLNPRFNIAPSQDLAVIREPHKLELLHWGLQNVGRARGINVRAETVARAPQYRDSFRSRRCLIVVDGFYEWQRRNERKQPFLVRRADSKAFALAGIWDRDAQGEPTCAVITAQAQGVVADLHDRMPVIIAPTAYARWLDPDEHKPTDLLRPDASELVSDPVSTFVNSPANDDPRCIEPISEDAAMQVPLPGAGLG